MEDWTEKYRPKHLHDIIGNERALNSLHTWAQRWAKGVPDKKAVVLSGKPGTGKTSSALALAHDMGWTVLELNASDVRNEANIKRIATAGAVNETFDITGKFTPSKRGGRKLIILDEADNLYEKLEKGEKGSELSDRGGKKAIIETIQKTSQPIVLIVNDYYELIKGGGEPLKTLCTLITFYDVSSYQIVDLLKHICTQENIIAEVKTLQTIADRCKGDVRSAVNDLQSLAANRSRLTQQDLDVLGYRDRESLIFDALREVFKTKNIQTSRDCVDHVDVDPETFLLWIAENLPKEYLDTRDLVHGFEAVAKADIFFGRANRWRHYDLWSYACDLMSRGVSSACTHTYGNDRYQFPTWMKEMKSHQVQRLTQEAVLKKLGSLSHVSTRKSREDVLPHIQHLFRNDTRFACKLTKTLDLTENEVKYLLGEKYLHRMKDILQCSEKTDEKQEEIPLPAKEEQEEEKPQGPREEVKQPSLFDF